MQVIVFFYHLSYLSSYGRATDVKRRQTNVFVIFFWEIQDQKITNTPHHTFGNPWWQSTSWRGSFSSLQELWVTFSLLNSFMNQIHPINVCWGVGNSAWLGHPGSLCQEELLLLYISLPLQASLSWVARSRTYWWWQWAWPSWWWWWCNVSCPAADQFL